MLGRQSQWHQRRGHLWRHSFSIHPSDLHRNQFSAHQRLWLAPMATSAMQPLCILTTSPYSTSDYANTAASKWSTQRYLHLQQNSNLTLNKVGKYVPDCDHYLNRELLEPVLCCVAVSPCLVLRSRPFHWDAVLVMQATERFDQWH